ncbi:lantibiotic dehydratase C-terminal domain-containing protein [Actinokineospora guangxiensis]|uniref:Lantibiotic dehydratase C-terminal domain-containing protein n=1 Tax=Actinokineospora guangxiensis TaxID=1490288 RepID=A0ABW0EVC0_9PSEU
MSPRTWIALHAYHTGAVDGLVLAAARAAAELGPWFFLRYWDGGPHVRVRVLTDDPGRASAALRTALIEHLRRNPSTDWPSEKRYGLEAAALAAAEGIVEHARSPRAADTVHDEVYRPERRFGGPAARVAVERHFVESTALAVDVLRAASSPAVRSTTAALALLTTWSRCPTGARWVPTGPGSTPIPRAVVTAAQHPSPAGFAGRWAASLDRLDAVLIAQHGVEHARWVADYAGHLLCNRLGIGPAEEASLRRGAHRAMEDGEGAGGGVDELAPAPPRR